MDTWMLDVMKQMMKEDPSLRPIVRGMLESAGWPEEEIAKEMPSSPPQKEQ